MYNYEIFSTANKSTLMARVECLDGKGTQCGWLQDKRIHWRKMGEDGKVRC